MYSKPITDSLIIYLLKIFKVDFENYEPYKPITGGTEENTEEKKEDDEKEEKDNTDKEDTEESTDEDEEKPFDWQLGEILEEYFYGVLTGLDFESDYTDISSSVSISMPFITDGKRFFKGVQGQILAEYFNTDKTITEEDIPSINKIFINDLTFKEEGTSLECKGFDILLDEKYEFDFHQMKRSKILEEMIKTAGLKAEVDPTGLIDDVIDYTNVSKSDSGSGADSDSKDLNELVKNAIKGKSGKREKAEAVHNALRDSCIKYRYYTDFQYSSVKDCFDHRQDPGLNCGDTSQLTVGAMKIAGLNAETLLTFDSAHYITRIEGQWFSDLVWSEGQCSQRPFDETWHDYRDGTPHSAG